jgi:hypothetical protein
VEAVCVDGFATGTSCVIVMWPSALTNDVDELMIFKGPRARNKVQNGGGLSVDKLVLLGFTSQAIRAAVVPESVSATPDPQPAKATAADTRA